MRETHQQRGLLTVLLASGVSLMPVSVLAATTNPVTGANGLPITPRTVPSIAPINTNFNVQNTDNSNSSAAQTAIQTAPVTQIQSTAPVVQKLDQTFTLPAIFGNTTILPTDTLPKGTNLPEWRHNLSFKVTADPHKYEFGDLAAFLHAQGWQGEIAKDKLENFDDSHAIIENSSFEEPAGGIVPIAYTTTDSDSAFKPVANSDADAPVIIQVNEPSKHFWVFTEANQFLSGETASCDDALLSGAPGTVVSSRGGVITMHKGLFIVDSGDEAVKVATKAAGLKLANDSTAMIDYQPGHSVAIRIIACPSGSQAKVRLAAHPDELVDLNAGEEITVDLRQGAGNVISRKQFSTAAQIDALPKNLTGMEGQLYKRFLKHIASKSTDQNAVRKSVETASAPVCLVGGDGARFITSDAGQVTLLSGRVLIQNSSPKVFRTKLGDIYLQKGAIASTEIWRGEFRLQCCSGPKSAILVNGKFGIPMTWGVETLVLDHQPTYSDAFPNDGVGRRSFELHQVNEGTNCIIADFSLPSLIVKGRHLKSLRASKNSETKPLRNQLIKTAAALQVVTGYKGQYLTKAPASASASQTN